MHDAKSTLDEKIGLRLNDIKMQTYTYAQNLHFLAKRLADSTFRQLGWLKDKITQYLAILITYVKKDKTIELSEHDEQNNQAKVIIEDNDFMGDDYIKLIPIVASSQDDLFSIEFQAPTEPTEPAELSLLTQFFMRGAFKYASLSLLFISAAILSAGGILLEPVAVMSETGAMTMICVGGFGSLLSTLGLLANAKSEHQHQEHDAQLKEYRRWHGIDWYQDDSEEGSCQSELADWRETDPLLISDDSLANRLRSDCRLSVH